MIKRILALGALLLGYAVTANAVPCDTQTGTGSSFQNAVDNLAPGSWCDADFLESSTLDQALSVAYPDENDLVQWQHGAMWSTQRQHVVWVGYDYSPALQATVVHDIVGNAITVYPNEPFGVGGSNGHVYDQVSMRPSNGNLFFRPRLSNSFYRGVWNGTKYVWDTTPAPPNVGCTSLTGEDAVGSAWDETRDVYVLFTDAGPGDGLACTYNPQTNSWSQDGTVTGSVGPYHQVVEYSPLAGATWMQAHQSPESWKNDQGTITKLANAPINLGCCGASGASTVPDPVTGKFIVTSSNNGTNRVWYEYDLSTDTWVSLNNMPPLTLAQQRVLGVPIKDYGVILYYDTDGIDVQLYLYKHAASNNLPTGQIIADPASVGNGGSSTLTWSFTNADSCTASDGWTGAKAVSGSEQVTNITATTTYTITCTNVNGNAVRAATVAVIPPPTVTLFATPPSVPPSGGDTTLTWSVTDATSCTATGGWTGVKSVAGGTEVVTVTQSTTYNLSCSGPSGSAQASVTVTTDAVPGQELYNQTFESFADGSDPTDWTDTAANNSMVAADDFKVFDDTGNKTLRTTVTGSANIHSHYTGSGAAGWANYEVTGRMKKTSTGDSLGVTVLSDYPNTDTYYRLRTYNGGAWEESGHGTNCTGTTSSGVTPTNNAWWRFRIQAEDTGAGTTIRARFWLDGDVEPGTWQIDCTDTSGTRRTSGTVGVWAVANTDSGAKYWDDIVVTTLGGGTPPPPLTADPQSFPRGTAGTAYSVQLTAQNGTPPYSWTLDSGSLPAGLTLNSDGSITGTPTQTGSFNFVARVTDSANPANTDTEPYTVIIDAAAPPPGPSNWATRIATPGVVYYNRFDNLQTDFCDNLWPSADPARNPDAGTRPDGTCHNGRESYYDTNIKASGNASVRFDFTGNSGEGFGGEIAISIEPHSAQFGGDNPGYTDMWVQWRQRWDQYVIDHQYAVSSGAGQWKQLIISQGLLPGQTDKFLTRSCSNNQIVVSNLSGMKYPQAYHACPGYYNIASTSGSGAISRMNFGDETGPTWPCQYWPASSRPTYGTLNTCKWYVGNQWITFMVHVNFGPRGQAVDSASGTTLVGFTNSTYELYMAYENDADWTLVHRVTGLVFLQGQQVNPNFGACDAAYTCHDQARYGMFRWLPLISFKSSEVIPTYSTWVDEIIISRNQIPIPSASQGDTTPPAPVPGELTLSPN